MAARFPTRMSLAAAVLSAALLGAAAPAACAAPVAGRPYVETRLFFGTARPDGGPAVTERQFRRFVDTVITPGFPEGLTIQPGSAQYRDAHGIIERERSYEVTLPHPRSRLRIDNPRIERIRASYDKAFGQESVARVDEAVTISF